MTQAGFNKQTTLPDATSGEPPPEPSVKETPEMIGPYRVEGLLDKGGMSLVYLGVNVEEKTPLIIKVLSPQLLSNKEVVARFLKEAEIIALADHPNIIKLYISNLLSVYYSKFTFIRWGLNIHGGLKIL